MESTFADDGEQAQKAVHVQIPETLHSRLSEHGRLSGQDIEHVVIRALDAYFDARGPELEEALRALDTEDADA